jgi:putative MATE family efflux protein
MPSAVPPRLWPVAWPVFVELGLAIVVGLVGTALAAHLSDTAGAAFALANHVSAALFILFRLVGAGVGVVVTQRLGARRRDAADRAALAALGASTWLGGFTALLCLVGSGGLLHLLNAPAEVLPLALPMLQWLAPALLVDTWNASMAAVMRAHLRVRDTLAVMLVMNLCQLGLAALLMHGAGPLPALGLPGFALSLAVSRGVGLALHLWIWRRRLGLKPAAADWWRVPRDELRAVLRIGVPRAAENIAYRLAFTVSVSAVATLGAPALATQAYVLQLGMGPLMFGLATGLAAEIVVGHLVGAGRLREAHRLVRRSLARGLALSVLAAGTVALLGPWLLRLFTHDPQLIAAGAVLLWWTVLLEPGRTFNLVVINALRAAGDARFPVLAGITSMTLVLAGGSWWLGVHRGWGLVGVWIAYAADEWIRGLLMWRRWSRQAWVPHARRSRSGLRHAPLAAAG